MANKMMQRPAQAEPPFESLFLDLDIYYAQASVSLTWPGAWTLLTTAPVAINAASTKIIEIPWNDLPGEGHYCMIARWSSVADPITTAEVADVNINTRQNNNIIWRNLNIVAMDGDEDQKTEAFFVQGGGRGGISIKFTDEFLFPKHAFTESGRVFVSLEGKLLEAWKNGGSKGQGIKAGEQEIEIISPQASLDNIVLTTKSKLQGTIRFVKTKETIHDRYNYTITQSDADGQRVAGGVSYEIYTYKR